ncbi:hypothetical protein [uncultured Duncaniella sp.]|jgi:hypothetical protein|uniref:hypothetical protein n=1 Tax=uncultured Duncaniella sp. TaxID=2768039 RepID=UPI0025B73344|nr:hypothetical protein [uncultured Duncaniella sp.]
MNTHLNSIRTIALVCIAGKAISVGFASGNATLSASVSSSLTAFLMFTLCYLSVEYGIRFFIIPLVREPLGVISFKRRKDKAVEQSENTITETLENISPLDTPKAQEVIAYTLGTFAGVLTNEELMSLDNNLKAFIIGEPTTQISVNRRISKFRTHDVYHFGWNIAKRLKISNTIMAEFLKSQFPWQLADVEISTIAKKLSSDEGAFTLPKVEPRLPLPPYPLAKKLGIC